MRHHAPVLHPGAFVGIAALTALLAGCTVTSPERDRTTEAVALPDRNQMQAQSLAFYLELLHRFAKAGTAEQAEIFANIRRDYDTMPTPSSELRYALAVATPGHPSTDAVLAQKLLLETDPDRFFAAANCRPETFAGPQEQLLRRVLGGETPERTQRTVW